MDESTKKERDRCMEIYDRAILEAGDAGGLVGHLLYRIRNMIANGLEPMTFCEQVERDLDELRPKGTAPLDPHSPLVPAIRSDP